MDLVVAQALTLYVKLSGNRRLADATANRPLLALPASTS